MATDQPNVRTLADRLNHLFATIHPPGRGPYTNAEVEDAIRGAGGSISEQYIHLLRNGKRDNPTYKHLEALAKFFDVPVAYFFDDSVAETYSAELRLLGALRDARVRNVALRAATLSPQALNAIAGVLEQLRVLEQLPETREPSPTRTESTRRRGGRRSQQQRSEESSG